MEKEKKIKSEELKKEQENYMTMGMSLGMCFGIAIGTAIGFVTNNIGICMCFGISIGMCIGMAIGSSTKKDEKNNKK